MDVGGLQHKAYSCFYSENGEMSHWILPLTLRLQMKYHQKDAKWHENWQIDIKLLKDNIIVYFESNKRRWSASKSTK